MIKNTIVLIVIILFYSCNEDDSPTYPIIKTIDSELISTGGVELIGDIVNLGDNTILDYGFEVVSEENTVNYNETHEETSNPEPGLFTLNIIENLHQGVMYHFNAYIRTETQTFRGDTLSFYSNGSAPPVLLNCEPSIAHIGDTVTLYTENLGRDESKILLYYGNTSAEILEVVDNKITFIVPRPNGLNRDLKVFSYGNQVTDDTILALFTPIINSTNPSEAFFGETIRLIGDHFNLNLDYTSVKVGGFNAQMISTSRNEVEIIIPEEVNYSNSTITLYAQNQYVDYDFNLLLPEITIIPDAIYTDEYFDITVTKTHDSKRLFYIGNREIYADLIDDVTYRFYLYSTYIFDQRENSLNWVLNDEVVQSDEPLVVSNPYYDIMGYYGNFPFNEFNAYTINGTGYVIGNDITNSDAIYYMYSYINEVWLNQTLIAEPNGTLHDITESNYAYSESSSSIYSLGRNYLTHNFLKIDPLTGFITTLSSNIDSDFPGKGFAHQDKVYFTNPTNTSLKAYSISNDSWEVISQVPYNIFDGRNYNVNTIVVDNYVYFANGNDGQQFNDFWRMNLNTYQWEQLPDNPNPNKHGTVYQYGNALHFVTDEVYVFDLSSQTWSFMEKHGLPNFSNVPVESFISDGFPYIIRAFESNGFYAPNLYFGDRVE